MPAGNFTSFNVPCAAHRSGSGVRGLTIEVRDSVGTVLGTAGPETEAADLILEDLDVSGPPPAQ